MPTWTFTATAEVVRYLGADPVLVDIDGDTLNLDLVAAADAVTDRTKAIMPVHFAGLAVDPSGLEKLAADGAFSSSRMRLMPCRPDPVDSWLARERATRSCLASTPPRPSRRAKVGWW